MAAGSDAINMKLGMSYYGDEAMFKTQLASFDTVTLDPQVEAIHQAWKSAYYSEMERGLRAIKSSAG